MSNETGDQDECPYCRVVFEIEVVRFSFFGACTAVFVCRNCGLTRADSDRTPSLAKRIFAYFTRRQRRRPVGAIDLGPAEIVSTPSRNCSETFDVRTSSEARKNCRRIP